MMLYYLNRSEFAHSDVLIGSLGLIIFRSGLPLRCGSRCKLMTKTGGISNQISTTYKTATVIVSIQIILRGTWKFWEHAEPEAYFKGR